MIGIAMPNLLVQLNEKVQKSLRSQLDVLLKGDDGAKLSTSSTRKGRGSSSAWEVNLEKQLQAWKENPSWEDKSPEIKVTVPKGSLCELNVKVNVGLPPDAVYNIITDPDSKRIFKNIKEVISRRVLLDEGLRQVVEVEQAATWKFLWWSGTLSVQVLVDQNREHHTMKFKQTKTGFMKKFDGCWRVEPLLVDEKLCHPFRPKTLEDYATCTRGKGRIGSKVNLEQLVQPTIVPPPPFSWYLRGITAKTTEGLITDLLAEAAKVRGDSNAKASREGIMSKGFSDDEYQVHVNQMLDIKQRWALRRRHGKQLYRRLPLPVK
ncbi:hypothetical protein NMG60_11009037 [Bertholletia excelsa]